MSAYYETITVPADQIQLVFGQFDRNIKNLEKAYHVAVVLRDDKLRITGSEGSVNGQFTVIEQLVALADKGEEITDQNVNYAISLSRTGEEEAVSTLAADRILSVIQQMESRLRRKHWDRKNMWKPLTRI